MPKTDYEQLKGILEEFDEETIAKVLHDRGLDPKKLRRPIIKKIADFPELDRGTESKVGDRNVVELESLIESSAFEVEIGEGEFLPVHFLECGAKFGRPVARVHVPGYWWGSGFLVSRSLFMTNNHVIPSESIGRLSEIEFNYQLDHDGNPESADMFYGDPDNFFYTNAALDFTIMRLKPHTNLWPLNVASSYYAGPSYLQRAHTMREIDVGALTSAATATLGYVQAFYYHHAGDTWGFIPLVDKAMASNQRINIIQHPRHRYKEVCLHDNRISHIHTNVLQYRTDTEPGSSGSPVFDNEWEILAIHHAAGDEVPPDSDNFINNEGIRIDSIIADLQSNVNASILAELGIP